MRGAASFVLFVLVLTACSGDGAATTTTAAASTATAGPTATEAPTTTMPPVAATTTTAAPTTTSAAPTTTAGPATYYFTVAAGSVQGPEKIEAAVGEEIVIVVSADVADEVHLHGYDVFADVAPDTPARLEVVTDIPGIFELELEGARLVLSELEVR
jgi:hypothetical protein